MLLRMERHLKAEMAARAKAEEMLSEALVSEADAHGQLERSAVRSHDDAEVGLACCGRCESSLHTGMSPADCNSQHAHGSSCCWKRAWAAAGGWRAALTGVVAADTAPRDATVTHVGASSYVWEGRRLRRSAWT